MTALSVFDTLIYIVAAIIPIIISLGVLVFFWGLVKFISHGGDEKAREEGKSIMIWGMVALFVMVALWAIVGYIQESLNLTTSAFMSDLPELPNSIPTGP